MSYWKKTSGKNYQSLDNYSNKGGSEAGGVEFYEFEPAIVLDVVLDENHDIFKDKELTKLDFDRWPADVNGNRPLKTDVDYSWIGRVLVRMMETQKKIEKEDLIWAYPLESNISEYPLINEIVAIVKYRDRVFYTRKVNYNNFVNSNENFGIEPLIGGFSDSNGVQKGNRELNQPTTEFQGPKSKSRYGGGYGFEGVAGRYFLVNKNIRALKRFEGDTLIESRFGQSIRFSTYDSNRENDVGDDPSYRLDGTKNPISNKSAGGGNPMIVIRNRQRPILKKGQVTQRPPLPPLVGTEIEKNVGGIIEENINYDGSTIAITSGMTITKWATSCYKKMFSEGMEEQPAFSPEGCTTFKYPVLDGDQIVINSDRIILSARWSELFQYSKKRFGIVTDSEYTVDAHEQIVLTTNAKTVINSPAIYLGQYNETNEPVMLGQTTISWLYELCNWLLEHSHWYQHVHTGHDPEWPNPKSTQVPVQIQKLIGLRDSLHQLLSRRVFVVGGGTAEGVDGGALL